MSAPNRERLERLLAGKQACISIVTLEEEYAVSLVRAAALNHARLMYLWSVSGGVQDGLLAGSPPLPETRSPDDGLLHFGRLADRPVCVTLDLAPHLRQECTLRILRNLLNHFDKTGSQLVMIDREDKLPEVIKVQATAFEIALPDALEIEQIVLATLRAAHQEAALEIAISRRAWQAILRNLLGLNRQQIARIIHECVDDDRRLDDQDINHVLASKRRALAGAGLLEYIETPVGLDEIGGLQHLKRWLQCRQGALTGPAQEFGLSAPRGVLMLGVQGAGKSLCAKAIATAWQRPLLRMDVGALYDRYIGESERRLRDSLMQAEAMAPVVLWIDEIEKAFASAASRSTDGGLSKRMFGTLLTWMQEHTAPVFLVATANDIEALPPELLRKGRFDEIFFVDLPRRETRRQILAIHLAKRRRDPTAFDLDALAAASDGFSGAEIEQAIISGLHAAFADGGELDTARLLQALHDSPPLSVTMAEQVAALREWAQGRCVPAD